MTEFIDATLVASRFDSSSMSKNNKAIPMFRRQRFLFASSLTLNVNREYNRNQCHIIWQYVLKLIHS